MYFSVYDILWGKRDDGCDKDKEFFETTHIQIKQQKQIPFLKPSGYCSCSKGTDQHPPSYENKKYHQVSDLLDSVGQIQVKEMESNSLMFSHIFQTSKCIWVFLLLLSKTSLVFCNSIAYHVSIKHQSSENFSKRF